MNYRPGQLFLDSANKVYFVVVNENTNGKLSVLLFLSNHSWSPTPHTFNWNVFQFQPYYHELIRKVSMNLTEFLREQRHSLINFSNMWMTENKKDPTNYPLELKTLNEWQEQLYAFETTEVPQGRTP